MASTEEGRIRVGQGYQVWYRRVGHEGIALLTLHGGPGTGHCYLEPLEDLAVDRPIVFYDQLGCGQSDQPDDRSLWRMDRFVAEIDAVRDQLGLERLHLLGHSWGGWLAIEYMLTRPSGVMSLVLASTCASARQFVTEAARLMAEMPSEARQVLECFEVSGNYQLADYEAAVFEFYQRHLCLLDPWPEPLQRVGNLSDNAVYRIMNGPRQLRVQGSNKDWDRKDRLHELSLPVLITVGRHDYLTPACAETLHQEIPVSRMVVFEKSSHMAHLEEPAQYCQVVSEFLREVESRDQSAAGRRSPGAEGSAFLTFPR